MHPQVESVVRGKNILLFKEMLAWAGYRDDEAHKMLVAGFPIVGDVPDSLEFAPKLRAARISVGELLAQSRSAQAAARLATTRSGDDELDEEVYAATVEEIEAGLLRGPFGAR